MQRTSGRVGFTCLQPGASVAQVEVTDPRIDSAFLFNTKEGVGMLQVLFIGAFVSLPPIMLILIRPSLVCLMIVPYCTRTLYSKASQGIIVNIKTEHESPQLPSCCQLASTMLYLIFSRGGVMGFCRHWHVRLLFLSQRQRWKPNETKTECWYTTRWSHSPFNE